MKFVSLAHARDVVSFEEALTRGVPADGSLYAPVTVPQLTEEQIDRLAGLSYQEVDRLLLEAWPGDEVPTADIADIVRAAATFATPCVKVSDKYILELSHGPTMAFKDFSARYLAALLSYFNTKSHRTSTVLVATSGDTGGAVADGFRDMPGVQVVVLYPKGRVSELQLQQLRRVASNVHSLEVETDFDGCQALAKLAFADTELRQKAHLTSANSISIGSLVSQTLFYARAAAQLGREDTRFVVPCGNLGNLTSGVMAQQMGVPLCSFLAVNNANDAFYRYSNLGRYRPLKTVHTLSNAMDIGAPNNMPRLRRLFDDSVRRLRSDIHVARVNDAQTAETMQQVYAETGYLLDPHAAVAWRGSEEYPGDGQVDVIVATASPLKFAEEIERATGLVLDNSAEIAALAEVPERYSEIPDSFKALKDFILTTV